MELKHQNQNRYIVDGKLIMAKNFKAALAEYMATWGSGGVAFARKG